MEREPLFLHWRKLYKDLMRKSSTKDLLMSRRDIVLGAVSTLLIQGEKHSAVKNAAKSTTVKQWGEGTGEHTRSVFCIGITSLAKGVESFVLMWMSIKWQCLMMTVNSCIIKNIINNDDLQPCNDSEENISTGEINALIRSLINQQIRICQIRCRSFSEALIKLLEKFKWGTDKNRQK